MSVRASERRRRERERAIHLLELAASSGYEEETLESITVRFLGVHSMPTRTQDEMWGGVKLARMAMGAVIGDFDTVHLNARELRAEAAQRLREGVTP